VSSKGVIHKEEGQAAMKVFHKFFDIKTDQNNLLQIEPKLVNEIQELDFFSITDLTEKSREWVRESGIRNGLLTIQAMHTTCVVSVNELDEPCLLGDINRFLRESVPKNHPYLHNSTMRTKNLCADDKKCDRNGDAHLKAFLYGGPSQTVIVKDGQPVWGQWQRLCVIDLDGPRTRRILIQAIGE
jgi:secondary thiamine-phosphate synthase enzyme